MGSAFHQLCPRYSGTLNSTAPTASRLWETFTFFIYENSANSVQMSQIVVPDQSMLFAYRNFNTRYS